jgi:hypothetical protein
VQQPSQIRRHKEFPPHYGILLIHYSDDLDPALTFHIAKDEKRGEIKISCQPKETRSNKGRLFFLEFLFLRAEGAPSATTREAIREGRS